MQAPTPFSDLVAVMARLRGPAGCPWDREQTLQTLRTYLVEETYELLEALERNDAGMIREELGDLLLEVVFLAQICSEEGLFGIDDVAAGVRDKLIRRHPHVFGGEPAASPKDALQRWEQIKLREKTAGRPDGSSVLDGVPRHLPALLRAHRISSKASMVGFDWKRLEELFDKLHEELGEFRQASERSDRSGMEEELGDLLFITANLGRFSGIDPEIALQAANVKFTRRFRQVEQELARLGLSPGEATIEQMEEIWQRVKREEIAGREAGPDQSTSSR